VAYNPSILKEALQARKLTPEQLSERLGTPIADLNRELRRDPEPRQEVLRSVARELALPPFVFYMERLPPLNEAIPDFRTTTPAPRAKSRETLEAIKLAEGIQRMLSETKAKPVARLPKFEARTNEEIERYALEMRKFFGISLEDQRAAKDARQFYVTCRRKIEDAGITVLQESFPKADGSGFCLADPNHPVVVVNTKDQRRARRNFTLAHELGHVLMGVTGISDPAIQKNAVEKSCNRFAVSFLVPASAVTLLMGSAITRDPDWDDVKYAAGRLKISQEAAVLRLEQLDHYRPGSHEKWKALVADANPDFGKDGGGGTKGKPVEQEKVKLAKYGFNFARAFKRILDQGTVSELNLYRATGLKPKYQQSYFDYVSSLTPNELQNLELDDG
jgi:Zn-dependent peptidase ImmA (M78 family)